MSALYVSFHAYANGKGGHVHRAILDHTRMPSNVDAMRAVEDECQTLFAKRFNFAVNDVAVSIVYMHEVSG